MKRFTSGLLLLLHLTMVISTTPVFGEAKPPSKVSFIQDIQPILAKHCFSCHGPDKAEGGVNFAEQASATAEADSGERAIVAGDTDASMLIARITSDDQAERMPPEGDTLSPRQIDLLSRWIEQGAHWDKHWAFKALAEITPPASDADRSLENPIDIFVSARLKSAGLKPNGPADRATLLRRAYYDLIGLPPTSEQIAAFVNDPDDKAFERVIDQLLQSPHYGERWGRHWLDLVRFAETNSFERDGTKANAWKYRDYVIRSLNDDKPYDQFVREQLAGDELDNELGKVTTDSLAATGFYRLGIWDDEPADPLQARYDELDDIITTTGQAFLGLTINCARCHDHKIDPIPQKDYYRLLSFFEDVTPFAQRSDAESYNQIDVSPESLREKYDTFAEIKRELDYRLRQIEQRGIVKMSAPDQRATEGPAHKREKLLKEKLKDYLSDEDWAAYKELQQKIKNNDGAIKALPPRETVLGLAQYQRIDKPTFVLFRGNPHSPADEVTPAFPSLFDVPPPELTPAGELPSEKEAGPSGRRLALAKWITDPTNRLTWRVMANRIWQFHFGRGIVRSSNNFGQLGTPPTHPELLDWLSQQFLRDGLHLKSMHRLIMTSQTYQRSSSDNQAALAKDPANDLLWRFDPRRLSAEEVRDSMLAANGSLNKDLYGPSIYPELSQEVLQGQSQPGKGWGKSNEQQRNRRSVYIFVKRSLLTPLLAAFDFPDPDSSCEARFNTLQPGQALALLNGEFAHQQAARLLKMIGGESLSNEQIAQRTIDAVLARRATATEIKQADALIEELQTKHGLSRQRAAQLYCLTVMNWNEFLFVD